MKNEIELMNDGDGVAIIGDGKAIEQFLASEGLPSKELNIQRYGSALGKASNIAQASSGIAANSGRWVKLTEKSATALKQNRLMKGSETGISRAVLTDNGGKISGILEIVKTPGSMLSNPAVLAGAAGIMAQLAMQQTIDEITDYLQAIDNKCDDILRAQKDAALADMIGLGMLLDQAVELRDATGGVSEVTWSKIQAGEQTLLTTQAYALRQLGAIAEKLEKKEDLGYLAATVKATEPEIQEWLVVLARCFQLQDSLSILELERVFATTPEQLEDHRRALKISRQNRLDEISSVTQGLVQRVESAAELADEKVLFRPSSSRKIERFGSGSVGTVNTFHEILGIEDQALQDLSVRMWRTAAGETRDRMVSAGATGVGTAKEFGSKALSQAHAASKRVSKGFTGRIRSGLSKRNDQPEELPPDTDA